MFHNRNEITGLKGAAMNIALNGKRALVCGSTQGIGLASAIQLADLGAEVTLGARDPDSLRIRRDELPAGGEQAHGVLAADWNDPDDLGRKVRGDIEERGPFHILVNNTGGPPPGPVFEAGPEAFRTAFTRHLICNQILVQAVVPGMKEKAYGRIINIISTSVRQPIPNLGVSNTTRGAVAGWAKTLSNELASFGITVNNVLPGFTLTERLKSLLRTMAENAGVSEEEMHRRMKATVPAGRFAEPAEVAAMVGFLATPAAAYVTGVSVPVDGGKIAAI